jgi:ATP/maltotriose-dependent transcriptional regulator MalT
MHTVRTHLQSIFRKLGANQRTDALVRAMHLSLLENVGPPEREGASSP